MLADRAPQVPCEIVDQAREKGLTGLTAISAGGGQCLALLSAGFEHGLARK